LLKKGLPPIGVYLRLKVGLSATCQVVACAELLTNMWGG
jgi:hypothetical protein